MRMRSRATMVAAVAAGVFAWAPAPAPGQTAPIHVLVSNGVKTVVDEIRPQWERAAGHPLEFEFGTTAALKEKIAGGAPFGVAMLTSEAISDLAKSGKVSGGSSVQVARCGIGMGMRKGASKPDIASVEGLKKTLHNAKSV